MPLITQRRWHYAGVLLSRRIPRPRRRLFLTAWCDFYDLWDPLWNFFFRLRHPIVTYQVWRGLRLYKQGRTEISL